MISNFAKAGGGLDGVFDGVPRQYQAGNDVEYDVHQTNVYVCFLYQEVQRRGFAALAPDESCGIVPLRSALRPLAAP